MYNTIVMSNLQRYNKREQLKTKFIKSSELSLKFLNKEKKEVLLNIQKQYTLLCNILIVHLWLQYLDDELSPNSLSRKSMFPESLPDHNLTARLMNSCMNQASSIVRSRIDQINEYKYKNNQNPDTLEKLKEIPILKKLEMRIDGKNSTIELNPTTKLFDIIVELKCMVNDKSRGFKLSIPLKKHKQFNKMWLRENKEGKLLNGIIIKEDRIQFNFEYKREVKKEGKTIGFDSGKNHMIATSEGYLTEKDYKGNDLQYYNDKVNNQEKGSKSYERAVKERNIHKQWIIKQLFDNDIKIIYTEDLEVIEFDRYWDFSYIFDKIKEYSYWKDVLVMRVASYYTSRRCNECGYVNKKNRNGEKFKCLQCKHEDHADINAAKNIRDNLFSLPKEVNQLDNFYWFTDGWEVCREASSPKSYADRLEQSVS